MENMSVIRLMSLIKPLSFEMKLEILSELTNNLKAKFKSNGNEKENLLNELFGSWDETSDEMVKEIYRSRVNSNRNLSFD